MRKHAASVTEVNKRRKGGTEVGIYKRKQESKKTRIRSRKRSRKQEIKNKNSTKKAIKKKRKTSIFS